jgi:hypothetical protein
MKLECRQSCPADKRNMRHGLISLINTMRYLINEDFKKTQEDKSGLAFLLLDDQGLFRLHNVETLEDLEVITKKDFAFDISSIRPYYGDAAVYTTHLTNEKKGLDLRLILSSDKTPKIQGNRFYSPTEKVFYLIYDLKMEKSNIVEKDLDNYNSLKENIGKNSEYMEIKK